MHLLNTLGIETLPSVFAALTAAGVVETASIQEFTTTTDAGGAVKRGALVTIYEGVPVAVKIKTNDMARVSSSDKLLSSTKYELTLPRQHNDERVDFDITKHILVTDARGDEPAKRYRAIQIIDVNGVVIKLVAERENDERS